ERARRGSRSIRLSSVVLPAPRKPVSSVTGVISAMLVPIQHVGRDLGSGTLNEVTVAGRAIKARATAGVTGNPVLLHQKQQGVAVAVHPKLLQVLGLPGRFALAPQPGAAAAVVADAVGREGLADRLGVHPRH